MKWFRFYSQALHDAKVQSLGAELFRAWVNLLCLANEGPERGCLPDLKQVAFALHIKEAKATQILAQLTDLGLLDADEDGSFRPHKWDKWQRASDDVNKRVKEHRRKQQPVSSNENVTLHVRGSNSRVRADSETDTETDSETDPLTPQRADVCVSINGSEPIPIEDAPKPMLPPVDPAELARVQAKADHLFPTRDFGYQVVVASYDWPLDWIDAALSELASSGKRDWHYLGGILKRYGNTGGPARASPTTGKPRPAPISYEGILTEED